MIFASIYFRSNGRDRIVDPSSCLDVRSFIESSLWLVGSVYEVDELPMKTGPYGGLCSG